MVTKFIFGEPVDTGAVTENIAESRGSLPYGEVKNSWPFEWHYSMSDEDVVYGLGEAMRGINKRGFKYVSWCSDNPHQEETSQSLYGAHNFILVYGKKTFGIFFDTASRISFDIGETVSSEMTVTTEDTGVVVYVITAESYSGESVLTNIVRQFRKIIGQSYIPPRWAFGFQQSRWGYRTAEDIRDVVKKYQEAGIPLDSVCMDIDYMEEYEDFTVDTKKFPDLKGLVQELKAQGIRLIPIIDAGVKVKEGYSIYDEGIKNNYFCKKQDGKTPYAAGVWPGRSHFTDFFNPEASEWFGSKYSVLTDQGIEGFWNDMNEPAMFYSDESLEEVFNKVRSVDTENLNIDTFFDFAGLSGSTANSMEDYKRFYHQIPDGKGGTKSYRHDTVHNLYGYLMTRSAGEGLKKISPENRMLIYSRASYIGAHRYGGIWTGDVNSWWGHLEQEIKVLPALNMCGFLYTGADIGGFGHNTTRDLVLRWTALGIFTPLMRNHSALGTRRQECYNFEHTEDFKSLLELRYALIPYLYSEYMKAALTDSMYFRPLSFDYPEDRMALQTEDQLMLGDDIMLAPVYRQNATGRYVYLPQNMTEFRWKDGKACTKEMPKGIHYVEVALNEVVFYIKDCHMVPLAKPCNCTDKLDLTSFTGYGTGTSYQLYSDNGFTRHPDLQSGLKTIVK